jgi:hypothetical protein
MWNMHYNSTSIDGLMVYNGISSHTWAYIDLNNPSTTWAKQRIHKYLRLQPLTVVVGAADETRATIGWVEPENVPVGKAGLLRSDSTSGDIGFDSLGLKPSDSSELKIMQTKELQHDRLAMLAAAGFLAQELVDGKGIIEHLQLEGLYLDSFSDIIHYRHTKYVSCTSINFKSIKC